jgi:hypothetical protein
MFLSLRVFFVFFQHVINFPFRFVPVPRVGIQSYFLFVAYVVSVYREACLILFLYLLFSSQHSSEKNEFYLLYYSEFLV